MHIFIYIYKYTYTYTHAHAHTHTYIYICNSVFPLWCGARMSTEVPLNAKRLYGACSTEQTCWSCISNKATQGIWRTTMGRSCAFIYLNTSNPDFCNCHKTAPTFLAILLLAMFSFLRPISEEICDSRSIFP